jgi:hypothetical protein
LVGEARTMTRRTRPQAASLPRDKSGRFHHRGEERRRDAVLCTLAWQMMILSLVTSFFLRNDNVTIHDAWS